MFENRGLGKTALALQQQVKDSDGVALTWDTLGYAHHHLGDYAAAIESYQTSVAILRNSGERYLVAVTLDRLGDSHAARGDATVARQAWREAAEILAEMEHPEADQVRAKLA